MPAPSPLSIATSAVNRLLKEESTYRKELAGQEERLRRLEGKDAKGGGGGGDEEGNREFSLKQEKKSIEETRAVFGPLHDRIRESVRKLNGVLQENKTIASEDEIAAAREALEKAGKV